MREDDRYQIGSAADRVGLSLRTLRYYEEVGLVIPSARTRGGFRLYTEDDIAKLSLIKHLKPLEFTLEELGELLDLRERLEHEQNPAVRADLNDRLAAYVDVTRQRARDLRAQLATIETVSRQLDEELRRHRMSTAATPHTE